MKSRFDDPIQSSGFSPVANFDRMVNIPELGCYRKLRLRGERAAFQMFTICSYLEYWLVASLRLTPLSPDLHFLLLPFGHLPGHLTM
jgi:hypothetical protein